MNIEIKMLGTLLVFIVLLTGCDSSSPEDEEIAANCSIAYSSPDNSYAKIVNTLDRHIHVDYATLPLGGTVNKRTCDLFGVFAGTSETFTIQECASGDFDEEGAPVACGRNGPTRNVRVNVARGEMETITVNSDFFRDGSKREDKPD